MAIYYWESPHRQITEDFEAYVIKVTDGDTIRVVWGERDFDFPIRLSDIQAPERGETGWEAPRDHLITHIFKKKVLIQIDPGNRVSRWGRILGRIIANGIDINEDMVQRGIVKRWEDRDVGELLPLEAFLE